LAKKAVCVTSGGMDSISMALAMIKDGYEVTLFHGDLGQKSEDPEHYAVQVIADKLEVPTYFVDIGFLGSLGKSSLTEDGIPVPLGMESLIESTYITKRDEPGLWTPGRNVVLLACAAAYGEWWGAEVMTWGANQSETAYPDNTIEFAERFTHMLEYGLLTPLKVTAPLYNLDKIEILKWGHDNGYHWVYEHTWSCDLGLEDDKGRWTPCGSCGCCCNRQFAFFMAEHFWGIKDNRRYHDEEYFKVQYLPDLAVKCTKDMWMYNYIQYVKDYVTK